MSDLVLLHHNEPMTTSLAIAEGVQMEHKSVIQLVRKYVEDLNEFGGVAFEMRPFETNGGNQYREFAFLNEQQATFLLTLMRNSEIVVAFKKALVKAFFALRDAGAALPPPVLSTNPAHAADLAVSADRTFRSFLRAARSAGVSLPQALRIANRQTIERTGMDILAELEICPSQSQDSLREERIVDPLYLALKEWLPTAGDGPWRMSEILRAATGIGPESDAYSSMRCFAARYLRQLGLDSRKMRVRGLQPATLWRRVVFDHG